MPFTDADIAQIRELIRDELSSATISIFEWKGGDERKTTVSFSPGRAHVTYGVEFASDMLDQIAAALAERFTARFR